MLVSTRIEEIEDCGDCHDADVNNIATCHMWKISEDDGIRITEPLNKAARNEMARKNPEVASKAIAQARLTLASREGILKKGDCVVSWERAVIPHHLRFKIKCPKGECEHLASVTNRALRDPAQYATDLMALANAFLAKPLGSTEPHLPFTRFQIEGGKSPDLNFEEERTIRTMEHAHWIIARYKSLDDMDTPSAEVTAKLVNGGKISPGLLHFMTTGEGRLVEITIAEKPSRPPGKANRKINNKRKELQGLVEPSHVPVKHPRRRISRSEELRREVIDLRQDSLDQRRYISTEEALSGEEFLVRGTSGAGSGSQPVQSKASKKNMSMSKNKKRPEPSRLTQLKTSRRRQRDHDRRLNLSQTLQSSGSTPLEMGPDEACSVQESIDESEISMESALEEHLPSKELSVELELAFTAATAEDAVPWQDLIAPQSTPAGNMVEAQNDAADGHIQESESDSEQGLVSFPTLDEEPDAECNTEEGNVIMQRPRSQDRPKLHLEIPLVPVRNCNGSLPDSGYSSPTTDVSYELGSGIKGLRWAYSTDISHSDILNAEGVWQWKKPLTCYQPIAVSCMSRSDYINLERVPVTISHENKGTAQTRLDYDGEKVIIVPHAIPWEGDLRSDIRHPDFIVSQKLVEYQACEVAGYHIWRHDRDLLSCRKSGCDSQNSDYSHSTIVCSGCGPRTVVRYCCFQHQMDDINEHWQECGHPDLVMQAVIDHATEPAHFAEICPNIPERHGIRSFALHRQRLLASLTYGLYTLFYPLTGASKTLLWPKQDTACVEMNERIERLLNIALFDYDKRVIIDYLYRLLRESLYRSGEWNYYTGRILSAQFISEFSRALFDPQITTNSGYCACEWYGGAVSPVEHSYTCPARRDGKWPRYGMRSLVESLEERYWILRAWRQQHPSLRDWRSRATGWGYQGLDSEGDVYELGPGWTGWGGEEDNVRE